MSADRIAARTAEQDRAYFAAHPAARSYTRKYVPGEFGTYPMRTLDDPARVVVAFVDDERRLRAPLYWFSDEAKVRADLEQQAARMREQRGAA